MSDQPVPDPVTDLTLVIPATNDHIRFARLMASAVGSGLGFDYDTLEDLRLAVSELCTFVTEGAPGAGRLTLTYRGDASVVRITGHASRAPGSSEPVAPDELTLQILDAVAGEHTVEVTPAEVRFTLILPGAPLPAT